MDFKLINCVRIGWADHYCWWNVKLNSSRILRTKNHLFGSESVKIDIIAIPPTPQNPHNQLKIMKICFIFHYHISSCPIYRHVYQSENYRFECTKLSCNGPLNENRRSFFFNLIDVSYEVNFTFHILHIHVWHSLMESISHLLFLISNSNHSSMYVNDTSLRE